MDETSFSDLLTLAQSASARCSAVHLSQQSLDVELTKLQTDSKRLQEEISKNLEPDLWARLTAEPLSAARTEINVGYLRAVEMQAIMVANRIKMLAEKQELIRAEGKAARAALEQVSLLGKVMGVG